MTIFIAKNHFQKCGRFHFTINGVKQLSEEQGFAFGSRIQVFNGTKWCVELSNRDNRQMGITLFRVYEDG